MTTSSKPGPLLSGKLCAQLRLRCPRLLTLPCSLFHASGGELSPLVKAALGAAPTSEWDAVLRASSIVFHSNTWIHVPCASKPESSFRFHSCVLGSSECQAYTAEQLLACCTKALHPLLNLAHADTSPDGVLDMEESLGEAQFFDALAHLAVLASAHLHSAIERSDRRFDVEIIDEGSTGLSATIAAQGDVAGRQEEIARMLSGAEVTAEARAQADRLLEGV